MRSTFAYILALSVAQAADHIIDNGAIILINSPLNGALIKGQIAPELKVELVEGSVTDVIRQDVDKVFLCTSLDDTLLSCESIASPFSRIAPITPEESKGIGYDIHVFEAWIALQNEKGELVPLTAKASSLFKTGKIPALHMPDSYDTFYADCYHIQEEESQLPIAKGILHVGANHATESASYSTCVGGNGANVLFVECDPEVAKICQQNVKAYGQRCVQVIYSLSFFDVFITITCIKACLSNKNQDGIDFFQSGSNGGMSSSLREFDKHKNLFPGVAHTESTQVKVWRFDDLLTSIPAGFVPEMNILLIDAQGMEYEILQGMEAFLTETSDIELAIVEVSHIQVYAGQKLGPDVDYLMNVYGFSCKAHCEPCEHCDRLYERRSF